MAVNFQGSQFFRDFQRQLNDVYQIKVNKNDPIIAEICLLQMLHEACREDRNTFFTMNKNEMSEQSKQWREREDEFMKGHFASLEKWDEDFRQKLSVAFSGILKSILKKFNEDELLALKTIFNQEQRKIRVFTWTMTFVNVLCLGGAAAFLKFW